jgi:hypothetical protein
VYRGFPVKTLRACGHQEDLMERGWYETIQLLGLDVMGVIGLSMMALAKLGDAARALAPVARRRLASRDAPGMAPGEPAGDAWPPKEWRPSH